MCSKSFSIRKYLKRHLIIHGGETPYWCPTCDKSFPNKRDLIRHTRIHTGEKPYSCSECTKSFNQPSTLKRHMRIHTEEKPFKCSQCTKSFRQSYHLKTHFRIHTGFWSYPCPNCAESFKLAVQLKNHICQLWRTPPPLAKSVTQPRNTWVHKGMKLISVMWNACCSLWANLTKFCTPPSYPPPPHSWTKKVLKNPDKS